MFDSTVYLHCTKMYLKYVNLIMVKEKNTSPLTFQELMAKAQFLIEDIKKSLHKYNKASVFTSVSNSYLTQLSESFIKGNINSGCKQFL